MDIASPLHHCDLARCESWSNAENQGCSTGSRWKHLDNSLTFSDKANCRLLCLGEEEKGCCSLDKNAGCFWKSGNFAQSKPNDGHSMSISCHEVTCQSNADCPKKYPYCKDDTCHQACRNDTSCKYSSTRCFGICSKCYCKEKNGEPGRNGIICIVDKQVKQSIIVRKMSGVQAPQLKRMLSRATCVAEELFLVVETCSIPTAHSA